MLAAMGFARNSGAASLRDRWNQRDKAKRRAASEKGVPVPGTGVRHQHKHKSGSNKSGSLKKLNLEWGASDRKQEDDQRGINNRARQQAIEDQVASFEEDESPIQYFYDELVEDGWADEYCPTDKYPRGSLRSDGTHRDLQGNTGNRNNDLPGSPGPYWWS